MVMLLRAGVRVGSVLASWAAYCRYREVRLMAVPEVLGAEKAVHVLSGTGVFP
jgi:hypothetical protein